MYQQAWIWMLSITAAKQCIISIMRWQPFVLNYQRYISFCLPIKFIWSSRSLISAPGASGARRKDGRTKLFVEVASHQNSFDNRLFFMTHFRSNQNLRTTISLYYPNLLRCVISQHPNLIFTFVCFVSCKTTWLSDYVSKKGV